MSDVRFGVPARVVSILILAALLLFPASAALADGNGATTYTQTFHNAVDTFTDQIYCIDPSGAGVPANITTTYNGVFHYTVNKAGDFWGTGTQTGTVVAVPLDPSLPTYTGRFTLWFGMNDNNKNANQSQTFTVHATGSDGSSLTFHETMHLALNANNQLVVSFDKMRCG